jgi:hypothetical protein
MTKVLHSSGLLINGPQHYLGQAWSLAGFYGQMGRTIFLVRGSKSSRYPYKLFGELID